MTATLHDVTPKKRSSSNPELEAAKELVRQAREQGLALTGPDGLLKGTVLMHHSGQRRPPTLPPRTQHAAARTEAMQDIHSSMAIGAVWVESTGRRNTS